MFVRACMRVFSRVFEQNYIIVFFFISNNRTNAFSLKVYKPFGITWNSKHDGRPSIKTVRLIGASVKCFLETANDIRHDH